MEDVSIRHTPPSHLNAMTQGSQLLMLSAGTKAGRRTANLTFGINECSGGGLVEGFKGVEALVESIRCTKHHVEAWDEVRRLWGKEEDPDGEAVAVTAWLSSLGTTDSAEGAAGGLGTTDTFCNDDDSGFVPTLEGG